MSSAKRHKEAVGFIPQLNLIKKCSDTHFNGQDGS